ncbi:OmpA family protein [Hymenobacter sp. ASUV-10]|uniref:OmpA family protein n=1 Tax=Hymenobacter aranciens TaxID=3063996 RepID=A0ABT9BA93_9BACT|nr:OmpA family protein [Hymenobacter sp. ASUV-10]MDO7875148.1 OmpA family protein [Hymenobacter sp. ASUV-10]
MLLGAPRLLRAQAETATVPYVDALNRAQLRYPATWMLYRHVGTAEAVFAPGGPPFPAQAILTVRPLPEGRQDRRLTAPGGLDSLWLRLQRLPGLVVLRLSQRDYGAYDEQLYDYTYATGTGRTHVLGRRFWRSGYEFGLEYRAAPGQDARHLAEGRQLIESFGFTNNPAAFPSRRYADQLCDDKMYGIAATRVLNGQVVDDCRSIHEFNANDLTRKPKIHRQVLPFQSYALAKGFDNCLYSVTKAPTDTPEYVFRYDPARHEGRYTGWKLPAQGPDVSWISGATDDQGLLYFMTSDAHKLVRINPSDNSVTLLWTTDPLSRAPFYPYVSYEGAGSHGNFCIDDAHTLYSVYSTNGSLFKIDLKTKRPAPDQLVITGLPRRGGYSDLLMQNDPQGRRRLYLAGPRSLYTVDLAQHQARLVRRGTYTDLAGCNLFRVPPKPVPLPPLPPTATWRGRVLDARTRQPLPYAQLHLGPAGDERLVHISPQGTFVYTAPVGRAGVLRAQLSGYLTADSSWTAQPGPVVRDILLHPFAVGATQQLDNVQFAQGQAVLLPSSFPALDQLAALLRDNPRLTIELRGHTDNVGPPEKNVRLSEERVAAVKTYLVERGIEAARIGGLGLGGSQPAASNEREETRKINRRVEFRVTGLR